MKTSMLVLSVLMLFNCRSQNNSTQSDLEFIGGKQATLGEFPATVRIVDGKTPTCTGAVIAANKVLTAAHCLVFDYNGIGIGDTISILYGTNAKDFKTDVRKVVDLAVPRSWSEMYERLYAPPIRVDEAPDIAVITVDKALSISKANMAQLDLTHPPQKGDDIIIGGFGCEVYGKPVPANADAKLKTDHKKIKKVTASYFDVDEGNGKNTPRLCVGDSGGPVYRAASPHLIIGVNAAFADSNNDTRTTDSFTRVDSVKGLFK